MDEASKLAFAILIHPELGHKDARLLGLIHSLQMQGRHVTHEELSEVLDLSVISVSRRLRHLREQGYITHRRVGSYEWWYTITLPDSVLGPLPSSNPSPDNPETPGRHSDPSPDPPTSPSKQPITASNTLRLISGGKDSESQEENTEGPTDSLSQEPEMTKKLDDTIKTAMAKGKKKARPKGERFGVRRDRRRERFKEKTPDEYNVNDLELVYQAAWELSKRDGRPFRWTNKDRGQAKDLIKDQGAASAAKLIAYATGHWESLISRFGVTGAPSFQAIYAYRRSWMAEALAGGPPKQRKGFAEHSDEDFDPGDTGWG